MPSMLQFDKGSLQLDHREHSPGEPYLIRNETYMVRRDVVTRDTAVTTNEKVLSVDFLSTRQRLVTISDSFTASDSESAYQGECAVAPALAGHSFLKMMENWIIVWKKLLLLPDKPGRGRNDNGNGYRVTENIQDEN